VRRVALRCCAVRRSAGLDAILGVQTIYVRGAVLVCLVRVFALVYKTLFKRFIN
jgi:hypothetical protein